MTTTTNLGHGAFFGEFLCQREVPGFSFSAMTPVLPPEQIGRHTHETAHFVLILAGQYISTARYAPAIAGSPLLVYNPPGTTHRDRFYRLGGRFLTISITPERWRSVSEQVPLVEEAVVLSGDRARTLAQRVAGELTQWRPASSLVAEGLSLELMAEVATRPTRPDRCPPAWLRHAQELLCEQCTLSANIAEIAAAVQVHPVHLTRTFRRFFHCTPGEYLRARRLEKAAALLAQTHKPLLEIALESGFADQSHFSKAFLRNYGTSPRCYRQHLGPGRV